MQKLTEKRPYEKPILEICGSMVESTLCEDPISGQTYKFEDMHHKKHHHGWW
jgi:hypothetical protein